MMKRIVSIAAVVAALALAATHTLAGELKPFDQKAFAKARAEGKTVVVSFHADWCSVCKKQAAAIPEVLKDDKFQEVVVFKADYDTEKALEKQLKVTGQSTLVVFKGKKEMARGQGITDPEAIGELLVKGL